MPEAVTAEPTKDTEIDKDLFGNEEVVLDTSTLSDDALQPDKQTAPINGHPEGESQKALEDGTPASEDGAGKDKGATPATDEPSEEDKKITAEGAALESELLGEAGGGGDPEARWQTRYADQQSHVKDMESARIAREEALASIGLKYIQTSDGIRLVEVEDYKSDIDSKSIVNELIMGLSEDQRDEIGKKAPELLQAGIDKAVSQLHEKHPRATASLNDAVLSDAQMDSVFGNFVRTKLANGDSRFPDADNPDVQGRMGRVLNSGAPGMVAFGDWASTSEDAQALLCEYTWLKVFHATHSAKQLLAGAKREATKKANELKKETSVTASGGGSPVSGQLTPGDSSQNKVQDAFHGVLKDLVGNEMADV